jgi:hypothetical protein
MVLDVFSQKLGDDLMPRLDADNTGLVAVQMLDAIQTVVNVLTDNDGGKGWTVTFDPGINAYTDRTSGKRHIVVSGKPLLDARPGTRLDKVAAIMTGFAVHEVGHTKLDFYAAIVKRWPGKKLPITLGNIIEDVVLELRTVERFPGFADNGEGNVFRPTLEWVAEKTCPTYPLEWKGSTGHKVNVAGQIVRYRDFVTFANDEATQDALNFVEKWAVGITADLTPKGCVTLIEALLDYMKASKDEEEPEPPVPPTTECEFPTGEGKQQIPNEDDDTEGGDEPTEGGDEPGEDGEDEGPDGEGKGNTEGEDGDDEGGTEGGDEDGDDEDGEGEDGEGRDGDGNDADHEGRVDAPTGANDGKGKGGSGQGVADTDEDADVDDGFDEADLDESFDDLSKGDTGQQRRLNEAEQEERVTTRMDAGAFGKMRVIWK